MRIYMDFLGCRLNEAEQASWHRQFSHRGHTVVNRPEDAQVMALNTCAVTAEAGRKSRRALRRLSKVNPQAKLVATGCYATLEPQKLIGDVGVDLIVPNGDKDQMVGQILTAYDDGDMPQLSTVPSAQPAFAQTRTRAFVKVQDGCRNRCSFCIVTVARGAERSRKIADVVAEVNHLVDLGYKEVVITGVHLGGYGSDINTSLDRLLSALLEKTTVPRIRLGSIEPWNFSHDFFSLFSSPRFCPHLHLPLQSGSDTILKRMIRRCTVQGYREIVDSALAADPSFHISTDIIVGFPGETEKEFAETLNTIDQIPFGDMHLFRYSPRQGTAATRLPNHVSTDVKRHRNKILHEVAAKKKKDFQHRLVGEVTSVLWERDAERLEDGSLLWRGYTDNYIKVHTISDVSLFNQITQAKLVSWNSEHGLFAEVL